MMKKYSWIAALVLALSLAFMGCPDGGGGSGGNQGGNQGGNNDVETVVFDLAAYLQDLEVDETDPEIICDTAEITPAGGPTQVNLKVILDGGVNKLWVKPINDWAGLDLTSAGMGFRAGDEILVKGTYLTPADGQILLNLNHSGWKPLDSWNPSPGEDGEFEHTFTLTAADIADISSASPKNIRIRSNKANAEFVLEQVLVKGMRPSTITALSAPVVTATATGVEWEAIADASEYEVYADDDLISTRTTTSIDLNALATLAPGTYDITVIALGITGVSSDSPASNVVSYTKPKYTVTIAAIDGVTAPVRDGTPVAEITATAQYTGTIAWSSSGGALTGNFGASTVYTATITLAATANYTFDGVAADFFTVAGADTVNNAADSGVITAVFPATTAVGQDTIITDLVITGLSVSVGGTPAAAIGNSTQYTGTVVWSPVVATFAAGTTYTATITLIPVSGFTVTGVVADSFTVAGADTVSYTAGSSEITAVFTTFGKHTDGSYKLDPTAWSDWYGATRDGNAISFTNGGKDYNYPVDFEITEYNSLEIVYSAVDDEVTADGVKLSIKVFTTTATRTDVAYPTLNSDGDKHTLTLNDSALYNKDWDTDVQTATGGFTVASNATANTFTVTFHSIIFKP